MAFGAIRMSSCYILAIVGAKRQLDLKSRLSEGLSLFNWILWSSQRTTAWCQARRGPATASIAQSSTLTLRPDIITIFNGTRNVSGTEILKSYRDKGMGLKLAEWFKSPAALELLKAESHFLARYIDSAWGNHLVQIGGPEDKILRSVSPIKHQIYIELAESSSAVKKIESSVIASSDELPLEPDSVDLILLPHVLEFLPNPITLLEQSYLSLKPGGILVILRFNLRGMGIFWRMQSSLRKLPWKKASIRSQQQWMQDLLDLGFSEFESGSMGFNPCGFHHSELVEKMGRWFCEGAGGVSVLLAEKQVLSPLIRDLNWQELPIINAPLEPSIRNSVHE